MKNLIYSSLLLLFICTQSFAQSPPKIRVPGSLKQGEFKPTTEFIKGKNYYSQDNRYFFSFQEDGNFVIYKLLGNNKQKAIWKTGTNGIAMKSCVFQEDGNLVLYDYAGKARWAANGGSTEKGGFGKGDKFFATGPNSHWLTLQNDGNLVIYYGAYPSTASHRWFSGSYEKN
jgi:hypothetical protein